MSVLWQAPRNSIIEYKSETYEGVYFFQSIDGMYGRALTADDQKIYLRPLTEVRVIEEDSSFEQFQQKYKGQ